ncbi:hypothetical protein Tco_1442448, partial [Tanacetum coccineum]
MEGRISNLGETLSCFIKESLRRQKESENLVWGIKKSYDQTFKAKASSIKKIESHLGKIVEMIQDMEEKGKEQFKKYFENLQQLSINIPFVEALEQMPKYAKFMKDLLAKKGREKDPVSFTIPYVIGKLGIDKELVDLGASISLMPYSMFA